MTGVVFGSGLIGLLAKHVLVGQWTVVPFSRSRFFSYKPPLADNFIVRDAEIDGLVADLGGAISSHLYRYAYSIDGKIVMEYDQALTEAWLLKTYLNQVPAQATAYWHNRMVSPIYSVRASKIYDQLLAKHLDYLKQEAGKGEVTEIGDHYYCRGGTRFDFDCAISTIPLPTLYKLMGLDASPLKLAAEYYYHIESDGLDLEGANQVFVVDQLIDFYRCTNIAPGRYLFYSTRDIIQPGAYFLHIIGNADLIDGTMIRDAVPIGPTPDLAGIEQKGIFCIGSCAQHDNLMDVGSCMKRLVRYARRDYQPAKPKRL